jgi:hypothetical protein
MPILSRRTIAVLVALCVAHGSVAAAENGPPFLASLLDGLRTHNVRRVAQLFQYPFRMGASGLLIPVNNPADMARLYDLIFNPTMRCAIEGSQMPTHDVPHPAYALTLADDVISMANGSVIARRSSDGFRITHLSVLGAARPPARRPQRLTLVPDPSTQQVLGRLAYDDVDSYVVQLKGGTELTARIDRFPGRSVLVRVRDVETNAVLPGAATEYARTWASRVERNGEYRIEVVRNAPYCDPDITYLLSVMVRRSHDR